jgi:tripartite-type tricarboxylate transporter receptor subunit TctC
MRLARVAALSALLPIALSGPSTAQTVADFYRGRSMIMMVGVEPGTGYDLYSRTLVRHMAPRIPGNPSFAIQNMPGSSGINAANWMANVAAKDGSVMGMFGPEAAFAPALGSTVSHYDTLAFTWLGNLDESVATCVVSQASGVRNLEDLKQKELPFAATGPNGAPSEFAYGLKNLLGAKIKVIQGYRGTAAMKLALENGEAGGGCGISLSTLKTTFRADVEAGRFIVFAEFGIKPRPEWPTAAHIYDFAKTEEQRQLFDIAFGRHLLGRPVMAPPGLPKDRADALETAFLATVKDPAFVAEAERQGLDINPSSGEEVRALLARFFATPKEVIARAEAAVRE